MQSTPTDTLPPIEREEARGTAALASVATAAVGAFVVISRAVRSERFSALDHAWIEFLGKARGGPSDRLARGVTSLGSVPVIAGLATAALASLHKHPRLAGQVALGTVGGLVSELAIKRFFHRERPTVLPHLEVMKSTSFPSGHSMAAASFYLTLAFVASRHHALRPYRGGLLAGGAVVAGSVAASRVYLGVHWPSDVLAGLALGTAWASASEAALG